MRRDRLKLLVGLGDERLGILAATNDEVGLLSVLSLHESAFYLLFSRLKKLEDKDWQLPETVQLLLSEALKTDLVAAPAAEAVDLADVVPFQAECFDSWKVPESNPFRDVIRRIRSGGQDQKRAKTLRDLQQAYLPARVNCLMDKKMGTRFPSEGESGFPRPRSEDAVASQISARSNAAEKKALSRGAELMRLGSKNAELRRHSSEEVGALTGKPAAGSLPKPVSELLSEKDSFKGQYEGEVRGLDKGELGVLVRKLMELQHKILFQVTAFPRILETLSTLTDFPVARSQKYVETFASVIALEHFGRVTLYKHFDAKKLMVCIHKQKFMFDINYIM
jgi:hypothetical protein